MSPSLAAQIDGNAAGVLKTERAVQALRAAAIEPAYLGPAELKAIVDSDLTMYTRLVKDTGITAE